MQGNRQLAAILFTDIVGYTSLMGRGEATALQVVKQNKAIQQPLVERYGGTWHKDLGDGSLCSFSSSVNAVQCAIAIQQQVAAEANFKLRIGIHLGDVTFQDGDVFGDGVNIASRIQAEAAEGGICLSEAIYNSVRNKEGIDTAYLGRRKLKNVATPMRLYQVKAKGVALHNKRPGFKLSLPVVLIALSAMLFGASISWLLKPGPAETIPLRSSIVLPAKYSDINEMAFSPDGKRVAFSVSVGGIIDDKQLYIRELTSFDEYPVPEGVNGDDPTFSPDGQFLVFGSRGSIWKYSLQSGITSKLCSASHVNGFAWYGDEEILFAPGGGGEGLSGLLNVSAEGGSPEVFLEEDPTNDIQLPHLTNGRYLLFNVYTPDIRQRNGGIPDIGWVDLQTGQKISLPFYGLAPQFHPSGHLTVVRQEGLFALPFDIRSGEASGEMVPIIEGLHNPGFGDNYHVSSDGTLAYALESRNSEPKLVRLDTAGNEQALGLTNVVLPRLSPNGDEIVYDQIVDGSAGSIWSYHLERGSQKPIIEIREQQRLVSIFSVDGGHVIYNLDGLTYGIVQKAINGPSDPEILMENAVFTLPLSISKDGKTLAFMETNPKTRWDIGLLDMISGEINYVLQTTYAEMYASLSPDQQFLTYQSDETGQFEVYVRRIPDNGDKWIVSKAGGTNPIWTRDGRKIFFLEKDQLMMASVRTSQGFSVDQVKPLIQGGYQFSVYWPTNVTNYDVNYDGSRIYTVDYPEPEGQVEIRLVQNWLQELEALVPVN